MIGETENKIKHGGEVVHASVTIIPDVNNIAGTDLASLSYLKNNNRDEYFLSMYYPYTNIPRVQVSPSQALDILYEVNEEVWEYSECDECPCEEKN